MKIQRKYIVWAVVIVLVLIVGIAIYKYIQGDKSEDIVDDAADEINDKNLTYNEAWYSGAAERIFKAFDGIGTDDDEVFAVIESLQTPDDWYKLIVEFDVREASIGNFKGNLLGWLSDELDASEKKRLSEHLRQIKVVYYI